MEHSSTRNFRRRWPTQILTLLRRKLTYILCGSIASVRYINKNIQFKAPSSMEGIGKIKDINCLCHLDFWIVTKNGLHGDWRRWQKRTIEGRRRPIDLHWEDADIIKQLQLTTHYGVGGSLWNDCLKAKITFSIKGVFESMWGTKLCHIFGAKKHTKHLH